MFEENFPEDQISEHVAIIKLPSLDNSRRHNHTFQDEHSVATTPRTLKENNPPSNQTINRLLYGSKDEFAEEHAQGIRKRHRHLAENIEKQKQLKERKLNDIQQELEGKRLADCTFKPRTNNRPQSTRSLQEFLESQYRFAQKVLEKKQRLKEELDEGRKDETFRPKLMSSVGGRSSKQPVHERLYNLRQKEQPEEVLRPKNEFRPTITSKGKNMVREGRVELNLYNDALRRQEKQKELSSMPPPNLDRPTVPKLSTEKYVAQKFIKEFYVALEEMNIQDFVGSLEYIIFNELLFRLSFVVSAKEVENRASSNERSLVYEAYRFLQKHGVTVRNVCVFLLALLGVYHVNPTNFDGEDVEEEAFSLTEPEGRKLQKHFDLLYRNRLSAEELKKTPGGEEYTFKPAINPESTALAQNYRNKMLQQTTQFIENHDLPVDIPQDGLISHADLLILNRLGKQKQNERKKNINEEEELRHCTFKPVIIDVVRNRSMLYSGEEEEVGRKHEELYNLARAAKKVDKNYLSKAEEAEAEEDKQCTFAPKINRKKLVSGRSEPLSGRDVEKSMLRMLEGRRQRELKNRYLTRGYITKDLSQSLNHSHNTSGFRQSHEPVKQEELPFLVIDVNLGEQTEQIVVYKDEIDQPQLLAQQFAARHGLEPESRQKLLSLLKQEISNILRKIEEEEEEQP